MSNWGQAIVKAKKSSSLANIDKCPDWSSHDVTATDMSSMSLASNIETFKNIQFIVDQATGHTIAMPTNHTIYIDNYVEGTTATSGMATPHVLWRIPTGNPSVVIREYAQISVGNAPPPTPSPGSAPTPSGGGSGYTPSSADNSSATPTSDRIKIFTSNTEQKDPSGYSDRNYLGSQFRTSFIPKKVPNKAIGTGVNLSGGSYTLPGDTVLPVSRAIAEQTAINQNVWWCLETDGIGKDSNVGFVLEIKPLERHTSNQMTGLVIRINPPSGVGGGGTSSPGAGGGVDTQWDIVFVEDSEPFMVDWKLHGQEVQTMVNIPSIVWGQSNEVMVMPLPGLGKLAISVNGSAPYVYSRPNRNSDAPAAPADPAAAPAAAGTGGSAGTGSDGDFGFDPFKFKTDALRVAGTNCTAIIAVHPIGFAAGHCMTGMMAGHRDDVWQTDLSSTPDGVTAGFHEPVTLPMEGRDNTATGFVSKNHAGIASDPVMVAIDAYHGYGKIMKVASDTIPGINYYRLMMSAENGKFGSTNTDLPIRSPAFYRAKGISQKPVSVGVGGGTEISDDIMSMSETYHSPDRACMEHTVEFTLYNEGGIHDDLLVKGFGIVIKLGWETVGEAVFTGVSLGGYRSEVAGKETVTIHCEDYMRILQDTLMINSPFYDGMEIYDAVWDMAKRAGLADPQNDTRDFYFLPAGYSFTEPKLRYAGDSNCKDNIVDLCRRSERVVYFDGNGILHLDDVQGGLAFTSGATSVAEFFSDPKATEDDKKVIIDEKRRESKLDSTVNQIIVKTVDRVTGSIILLSDTDTREGGSPVLYRKKILMQQPALGCFRSANEFMTMLAQRVYKPIKGITIKTMTDQDILPMDFITVDGEQFRVMRLSRQFDAAENSLITTISGEFMGI